MEFKAYTSTASASRFHVDIGTEWNLKVYKKQKRRLQEMVDIGTEWNLKASE